MTSGTVHADDLVIGPDRGDDVPALGMRHKVDATHCGGRLLVMEGEILPGQLIPPHTHSREDECAYILSGVLMYQLGEEVRTVSAGTYVVKPRGVPHAFWNAGSEPARVMELHVPATFARFYDELAAVFAAYAAGTEEWRAEFDLLNARYGLVQHWDRVAGISARYGVGLGPS
jgi:quercetin dioxygenase-like cupin family protein